MTQRFPCTRELEAAMPCYEVLEGWGAPLGHVKRFEDLPARARTLVERLEALIEVPIRWVSFGPHREQVLMRS